MCLGLIACLLDPTEYELQPIAQENYYWHDNEGYNFIGPWHNSHKCAES